MHDLHPRLQLSWWTHSIMRILLHPCTIALALLVAPASSAQPSDADRRRALELGNRGVELYDQGRWVDACERFAQADATVHSPVFVLYMARAKRLLGNLVESKTLYRRIIDEALPDGAPPQWVDAQRDASEELRKLEPLIPRLTITLQVPAGADVRVWLDDRELRGDELSLAVDPGDRWVSARCENSKLVRRPVQLAEGEQKLLTLAPPCRATAALAPVVPVAPPQQATLPDGDEGGSLRVTGVVLMIVGGASLAVGVGTGIGAIALDSDLADACNDDLVCPPDREADVDRYYALAHTSTTTLAIGAAALAAGLITYWIAPADSEPAVSLTPTDLAVRF